MKIILIFCLFAVCLFLFFSIGAYSKADIEKTVRTSLEQQVPVSLALHLTSSQNAHLEEVKVIQIGKVQGKGDNKYWHVKIYARSNCIKMFGGRQPFEGQTEYLITKDAYVEWEASAKRL